MAHYLITGHTGFKGSWLTLLLRARGHEVSGLALEPPEESLFVKASIRDELVHDLRVDIREREATFAAVKRVSPDFVIHMAAQALVREGYRRPLETYDTNVNGTLNVLHAVDSAGSIKAQLIVTTDKVYEDRGLNRPYVESDPLGGQDPYSASKAMADILSQQWLSQEGVTPGAIARAGNVIGAGDFSQDRLIPDTKRAVHYGTSLEVRYPHAVRPWQHVLDCLNGYLTLITAVGNQTSHQTSLGAWNFGPTAGTVYKVADVIAHAKKLVGPSFPEVVFAEPDMREDTHLSLNSTEIFELTGWVDKLSFGQAVDWAFAELVEAEELAEVVRSQVAQFEALSR